MPDALTQYRTHGWAVFDQDAALADWARACVPVAQRLMADPAQDHWWRCGRTWFAGVNVLPNTKSGAVPADRVPPLSGTAFNFVTEELGFGDVALDAAQISVVTEGYPAQGDEETEAAWRYRVKRCAAHVDGLERIMPERRRKLSETHSFLLGIPLGDATVEQGAFVIWTGSHGVVRAAFRERFRGIDPAQWRDEDITDAYTQARKLCFETCEPVELAPGMGGAYVMHPLALHGVAPWRAKGSEPRAVAYFRPDAFGGDAVKWLNA